MARPGITEARERAREASRALDQTLLALDAVLVSVKEEVAGPYGTIQPLTSEALYDVCAKVLRNLAELGRAREAVAALEDT